MYIDNLDMTPDTNHSSTPNSSIAMRMYVCIYENLFVLILTQVELHSRVVFFVEMGVFPDLCKMEQKCKHMYMCVNTHACTHTNTQLFYGSGLCPGQPGKLNNYLNTNIC